MVVEQEILDQVKAMEALAIELSQEEERAKAEFTKAMMLFASLQHTSRMQELSKKINRQGKKLEWRGSNLEKLPALKEVAELKKCIASARAGVLSVSSKVGKFSPQRPVRNIITSIMNSLKRAREICEAEPWINDLNREGDEEVFASFLLKKRYYQKFNDEEHIDILSKVIFKTTAQRCFVMHLAGVRINGLDVALLIRNVSKRVGRYYLNINLKKSKLLSANFSHLSIIRSSFEEADMRHADFTFAMFGRVNCLNADLSDTNFTSADLKYTNFSNADMKRTILDGADIAEADFAGVLHLTEEQFRKAKNWQLAKNIPSYLENIRQELGGEHVGRLSLAEGKIGALSLAQSQGALSLAEEEAGTEKPKTKKRWRLFRKE